MTLPRRFVEGVVRAVFETAVSGTIRLLASPPGRTPDPRLVQLSEWYIELEPDQRANVDLVVALAADQAVFGMMVALDGGRRILSADDPGQLDLELRTGVGSTSLTAAEPLHDLYRELVDPTGRVKGNWG